MQLSMCMIAAFATTTFGETLTFFNNGGRYTDTIGTPLEIERSQLDSMTFPDLMGLLHEAEADLVPEAEVPTMRVYSAHGIPQNNTQELTTGDYFVVPADKHWMWSHMEVGNKVFVEVRDFKGEGTKRTLRLESIAASPKVFYIDNLLDEDEADALVELAAPKVKTSTVGNIKPREDPGRTSENIFDSKSEASERIIKRVYDLLRMDYLDTAADGLQIVKYGPGKFYNEHMDYIDVDNATPDNSMIHATGGTNRYATVFFYLNHVEEGGQTGWTKAPHLTDEELEKLTPELRDVFGSHKLDYNASTLFETIGRDYGKEKDMVEKCHSGLSSRPVKLGAVLFYNTDADLVHDKMTLHTGCPVIKGTKWGANLWVWSGNKEGRGVPASLSVKFNNKHDFPMQVWWKNNEEYTKIGEVLPGHSSEHTTYHRHEFEFRNGEEVLELFKINYHDGVTQNVNIPSDGEQPISPTVSLDIVNDALGPVTLYWFDGKNEHLQDELFPNGRSSQNTYHSHQFNVREGRKTDGGDLVFSFKVDGHHGPKQVIEIERGSFAEGHHHDEL